MLDALVRQDAPDGPQNDMGFSYPGTVISSQVVSRFYGGDKYVPPGTFDENRVDGSNPDVPVFHYNAELEIPFEQAPDGVVMNEMDIWHFQDDAVSGEMKVYPSTTTFERRTSPSSFAPYPSRRRSC